MVCDYDKAYKESKKWIKEHGIPNWFVNISEKNSRALYKAINDFGVLSAEEESVYNEVAYDKDESRVYYKGGSRSVKGYTEDEINGVKKFLAHSYIRCMAERDELS